MEVSGQLHAPAALPMGERTPQYSLNKRLGGLQSWKKKSICRLTVHICKVIQNINGPMKKNSYASKPNIKKLSHV
jgi:hypothetical protein